MECNRCGLAPSDLPYEDMGVSLEDMTDLVFDKIDGEWVCEGCRS